MRVVVCYYISRVVFIVGLVAILLSPYSVQSAIAYAFLAIAYVMKPSIHVHFSFEDGDEDGM